MLFSATRTSWGCFDAQKGLSELPAHPGCSENVGSGPSAMRRASQRPRPPLIPQLCPGSLAPEPPGQGCSLSGCTEAPGPR